MNNKKPIFLSIIVLFIGILITTGTFAFFNWQSNNNKGLSFNVASNLKNYIEYDNGDSTFVGDFQTSSSFTDGIHSTISIKKKQEAASIQMVATINMDINSIGPNMAKSSALKWVVTSGNSSNVGPILSQGNFIGSNGGDTLMLLPNIEVTTSVKEYTIWIWLDINEHPSDALSGETLDTAVWTQIEQLAGKEEIYEITKISANYQRISATVINNKNVIIKYAIMATTDTPTSWTNIDTNLQNNIYNLEYDTSATGTYYVWFMDSVGIMTSSSISVTNIDTTAPSCTFGEFSVTPIKNNETSQITLTCIDNESMIENHNLTKDNLITSSSVVNITNVRKEQVTNGYKYTITVTGTETDGSANITLPANTIRNSMSLGNTITTSTASVTVRNIIDLSGASITLSPTSFTYDGTAKEPSITVTLDGDTLTRNIDYGASFTNNINVGTATVLITGINDYEGSTSATFTITKATCAAPTNVSISTNGTVTWTGASNALSYEISIDNTNYTAASSGVDYKSTITASSGNRIVYVRSVCDSTNYNTPSTAASTNVSVYSVTLTKGTGIANVTGAGNYITGTNVSINATLDTEYIWNNWSETSGGSVVSTTQAYSATITSNWAYTANAIEKVYLYTTTSGTTYTDTLSIAFTNVTNNGTITALKDNTSNMAITNSKNVTLDTNGKTITLVSVVITNSSTLTINGNGSITRNSVVAETDSIINNNGILITQNINLSNNATEGVVIKNYGLTTIQNNSIISGNNTAILQHAGTINIESGASISSILGNAIGRYSSETGNGTINITGGTLTSSSNHAIGISGSNYPTILNVSNAIITGTYGILSNNNLTATITSGTVYGTSNYGIIIYGNSNVTLTIGTDDSTINAVPKIIGSNGKQAIYTETGWNYYDGELYSTNQNTYNTIPSDTPTGYRPVTIVDTTYAANGYKSYLSNEYEVTANANGGSISSTSGWSGTGASATKNITYGSTYGTLPSVNKNGYTFIGWSVSKLPSDYQEVEYIEANGTQYIDTGVKGSSSLKIQLRYLLISGNTIIGYRDPNNIEGIDFRLFHYNNQFYLDYGTGQYGNRIYGGTASYDEIYDVEVGNRYVKDLSTGNNIIADSSVSAWNQEPTIGIFGANIWNGAYNSGKIFYMKIYDNDILIRDFVPCYRKSDGVAGLYDVVNGVFYTNSGSGIFNVGPNINVENIITENTINNIASNHTIYANWTANELTFNNQTLSSGTYATAYTSTAFTGAANGTGNYTYTIKSGAPAGATINSTNRTISFNNSTIPGTYSVVVTATDNNSGKTKDATMQVTINKATLTPSVGTCSNKTYDGGTGATCTFNLATVKSGDTVTASGTCVFADKNVGNAKTITCTGITISGAQASYYQLSAASASKTSAASITQRSLTPSVGTCNNKTYDGGTGASCGISVATVLSGDTVTASGTCNFADKNVGNAKTITCTGITLGGAQAGNYQLSAASASKTSAASITKRSLTPSVGTCNNKTYDGGTGASCGISVATVLSGDTVTASGTCNFADKNVGNAKTITCTGITLGGAQAGNYQLSAASASKTSAASITKRSLTPSVGTCSNKTYNGNASASCTISIATVLSGDTVTASGTCNFADANAGNAKTVTCTGISLGGGQAGNYSLSAASASKTSAASILKATCTAPTGISISTAGVVTWTNSGTASSYQISIDNSNYSAATSGVNYKSTIIAAAGNRTVYVRSTCNSTNYNTPSAASSTSISVYTVTLAKGTGISAVSGGGNYIKGSTAAIDATVNAGFTWSKWTQTSGGAQVTTTKAYSAAVNGNWAYTANAVGNIYTLTFYYNNNTTAGGTTAASTTASCQISSGTSCNVTIPAAVRSSVGTWNNAYAGLSTSVGNMTQAVASSTTAIARSSNGTYYAFYRTNVTNYYYGSSYTSRTLYRNQWFSSNTALATTVLSTSNTGTSNYGTAVGPGNAAWAGLATSATTAVGYSSVASAALANVTTLYTIYQFSASYLKGSNVGSIGATANSCKVTSSATACNVTLPSITPNSGYLSVGWNTTSGATTGTPAGSAYSISSNGLKLYANAVGACTINFNTTSAVSFLQSWGKDWAGSVNSGSIASMTIPVGSSSALPYSIGSRSKTVAGVGSVAYIHTYWCNTINTSTTNATPYGWCQSSTERYATSIGAPYPVDPEEYTCTTAGTYTLYAGVMGASAIG